MNEIIKFNCSKIEITNVGVIIDDSITELEWAEAVEYCEKVDKGLQWIIGELLNFGEKKKYRRYVELMSKTNYQYKTLRNIQSISNKVEMSRRRDTLTFSHHAEVASLSPEKQIEWLDKAEDNHLSVKQLHNGIRNDKKQYNIKELPIGVYDLLYCDPPWQYTPAVENRQVENHYPTMSDEDIYNFKLPTLSNDCLLLIWATVGKLPEALKTINSWGFTYKSHSVWDKQIIGMGYWYRGQHELLLIATKGTFSPPEPEDRTSSIYSEKRTEHSRKPEYYYEWIEKCFPNTNKIELFSRNKRDGWEAWGNE